MRGIGLVFMAALLACGSDPQRSDSGDAGGGGAGGSAVVIEPLPLPAEQHSHGDPSPEEQDMLELIQRARANPPAEGPWLAEHPEAQSAIQSFGVDVEAMIAEFQGYPPVPPLCHDARLAEAALFHSEDMAGAGYQGHTGSQGDGIGDRAKAAGYDYSMVGENVFAYAQSVEHCHAGMLVDWGNPDLGHRKLLLDLKDRKRHIGLAIVDNPASPKVGPLVVTQVLAMPLQKSDPTRYVVGVAYQDLDADGEYDPGEGRGGLSVVVEGAAYYAITSTSGGYAVPVTAGIGAARVQLQDGGVALQEATTSIAGDNVKVDFVIP